MLRYLGRRLLIFAPTLILILLVSFMISRNVPGDPVSNNLPTSPHLYQAMDAAERTQEYARISHEMGLDLPVFYFSLNSIAYPDTLHRILVLAERKNLHELVGTYGNWPFISAYFHQIGNVLERLKSIEPPPDEKSDHLEARRALEELLMISKEREIQYRLVLLDSLGETAPSLRTHLQGQIHQLALRYSEMTSHRERWRLYVPTLRWYGAENQFHHWISGVLRGHLGKSYQDHLLVGEKIKHALPWTVFMGFFSFILSTLVAILLGVYSIRNRHRWQDHALTVGLFLMNSVPTFVTAMLLMTFVCNEDYLQLFPTSGVASDGWNQWPLWYRLVDHAYHLTLPTLVFSYHSVAFISRQLRAGMLENMNLDFIRTARAKGLSERTVFWRHGLRTSLLPLVTHFGHLIPTLVGGALITEYIFSVPGMGLLAMRAMSSFDHPVMIAVFTIGSVATLTGILLSDILYAIVDPRISYSKI
jgi:peptide/nickel transport system permease protein